MTTEDDFRRAIDAQPADWQLLLVFSDWLRERGDDRADGYQALGRWRKHPYRQSPIWDWMHASVDAWDSYSDVPEVLPSDWWQEWNATVNWRVEPTSAFDALDTAARVFPLLPEDRQSALLGDPVPA